MRSGSYIHALGRQSFEPSQPATSPTDEPLPSEQANERQRELIKAQNDVLATVGVCLRDTKRDMEKTENTMAENEVGLCVGALDLTITYLASWPIIGIRNRLQAYRAYNELRFRDVLRFAWRRDTWGELFSGMPAHLCYQLSNLTKDYFQARFMNWLEKQPLFRDPNTGEPRRDFWLHIVNRCISFASWFVIYPLWHHSSLQALHLAPPSPVFPGLRSFIAFTAASPISLPLFTSPFFSVTNAKSLVFQAATSYFLLSFLTQALSVQLHNSLYHRMIELLPAPSNAAKMMTLIDDGEEMMAVEIDMTLAAAGGDARTGYTATIPFDPVTGEIVAPPPLDASNPLELDETDIEDHNPLPPNPPPPPQTSGLPRRGGGRYRDTALASHPVNVAASHVADSVVSLVLLVGESAMLRTLAGGVLAARGVRGAVYAPMEMGGWGLVAKAVVGEWGLLWVLFEASWGVSTWVGIRWFGYERHV